MQASPNDAQIKQRIAKLTSSLNKATDTTLSTRQRLTTHDPGVKGPVWVSRSSYPKPPEDDVRKAVLDAISHLGDGTEHFDVPEIGPLETEWVGWRDGVNKNAAEALGSELERYEGLMSMVKSDVTVFYVCGGAFLYASNPVFWLQFVNVFFGLANCLQDWWSPHVSCHLWFASTPYSWKMLQRSL